MPRRARAVLEKYLVIESQSVRGDLHKERECACYSSPEGMAPQKAIAAVALIAAASHGGASADQVVVGSAMRTIRSNDRFVCVNFDWW